MLIITFSKGADIFLQYWKELGILSNWIDLYGPKAIKAELIRMPGPARAFIRCLRYFFIFDRKISERDDSFELIIVYRLQTENNKIGQIVQFRNSAANEFPRVSVYCLSTALNKTMFIRNSLLIE